MNKAANANLFSRLFDHLDDPSRLAIETLDGQRISYGDLIARAGQMANVLVARAVKPRSAIGTNAYRGLVMMLTRVWLFPAPWAAAAGEPFVAHR